MKQKINLVWPKRNVSQHETLQGAPADILDEESMDIPETNKSPAEPNSTDLDESFSFTESLSQDKTFQEATLIATLAETFGLTKFKPLRKEIIKATLEMAKIQ